MATLIEMAELNDVRPKAWFAEVLARVAAIPQSRTRPAAAGQPLGAATARQAAWPQPARAADRGGSSRFRPRRRRWIGYISTAGLSSFARKERGTPLD